MAARADWIIGADWEALLELPLSEVRDQYRIEPAAPYRECRSRAGLTVEASWSTPPVDVQEQVAGSR